MEAGIYIPLKIITNIQEKGVRWLMAKRMLTVYDILEILDCSLKDAEQIVEQLDFPKIIIDGISCVAQNDFANWVNDVLERSIDLDSYQHRQDEKLLKQFRELNFDTNEFVECK